MNTLLAEQPWMSSIFLGFVGGALLYAWLQTGKKWGLIVAGICFLLIPGAFVLAEKWETEREKILAIVYRTASAVESNHHEQAVSVIGDEQTKQAALRELPRYEFTMAQVHQIRSIKIDENPVAPTAIVQLVARAEISGRQGRFASLRPLVNLDLSFEKRGDRWVVVDYHHSLVLGGSGQAPFMSQ